MAKILMAQTIAGCMDGIHPKKFISGGIYAIDDVEINQRLADMFLKCNAATIIRERKPVLEPSEKAVIEEAPKKKKQLSVSEAMKVVSDTKEDKIKEDKPKKQADIKSNITMRVFNLADKLKVSWQKIIESANKLDIPVKAAQSGLTEKESALIESEFKK